MGHQSTSTGYPPYHGVRLGIEQSLHQLADAAEHHFNPPRHATHPTACRTCRRRGRKCDKTLPSCQSCKDRYVECEGYVTRWPGVAARGKLRGKTIPILVDEECGDTRCLVKRKSSVPSSTTTKTQTSPPQKLPIKPQHQRHSQEVSRVPHSSAIEWIFPGTSDSLDPFIDYCESRV